MSEPRETYARQAFARIRQLILDGEIAPGTKMVVRPLAERLGLSPTPIKAALAALERDGFLIAVTNRGYFVPSVDDADMREIYELREVLDGIAARKIAQRDDRDDVVRDLRDLHARQQAAAEAGDIATYGEVNLAFHRLIWHASDNTRLGHLAETLVGQTRLATDTSARSPGRMDHALREHGDLVDAMERGDATAAERLARSHVRRSSRAFSQQAGAPD